MLSVHFKFKTDPTFETYELEGGTASISVSRLRQVITDVKLKGSAGAFGLMLSNVQTGQGALARPLCNRLSAAAYPPLRLRRRPHWILLCRVHGRERAGACRGAVARQARADEQIEWHGAGIRASQLVRRPS